MIRVYKFGLLPPVAGHDLIEAQLRASHELRNDLTSIERGRRAYERDAIRRIAPDLLELEQAARDADEACAAADREIRAARAATRSRSETAEQREALKTARAARKVANAALALRRREIRNSEELRVESDRVNGMASDLSKAAYSPDRVYWGNRALASAAMDQARKAPLYDGLEPNDPRFRRWDGSGSLGVQILTGTGKPPFHASQLFGAGTQVRIDPVDTWCKTNRRGEERRKLPLLHLRVGSDDNRGPIFASWPIVMHRDIPPDATVAGATVHRARRGPRVEWSVSITVRLADGLHAGHGTGTAAVNFGWRAVPSGIRVATWVGSDGDRGELVLTKAPSLSNAEDAVGALRKAEELQSIRDKSFDAQRASIRPWLDSHPDAPKWLVERCQTMGQWKSIGRLVALVRAWSDRRFQGDEEIMGSAATFSKGVEVAPGSGLLGWLYHDKHLWAWQEAQRGKALRHRREVYRVFAAILARRYETVVVEDFDLRTVARGRKTEDSADNETARSNRQLAAVSDLRLAISNSVTGRGGTFRKVAAAPYTHVCHACGAAEAFDASASIAHLCSACKVVWDQDENAARNILAAFERSNDEPNTAPARTAESQEKRESKWAKAKRKKEERNAARNAVPSAAE